MATDQIQCDEALVGPQRNHLAQPAVHSRNRDYTAGCMIPFFLIVAILVRRGPATNDESKDVSVDVTHEQRKMRTAGQRRNLTFQAEFLVLADILAGCALISNSKSLCNFLAPASVVWTYSLDPNLGRYLGLFSIIGALLMREPGLSRCMNLPSAMVAEMMIWRVVTTLLGLLGTTFVVCPGDLEHRAWPAAWLALFGVWTLTSRTAFLAYARYKLASNDAREAVAVVGAHPTVERIAARVADEADIVAVIDPFAPTADLVHDDTGPDALGEVELLARGGEIDAVIVACDDDDTVDLAQLVGRLKALPVQVALCLSHTEPDIACGDLRMMLGMRMAVVATHPMSHWGRLIKGVMDRAGAATLLVALLPVMALVALAIFCETRGPIFFCQHRNGWAGQIFTLYKFRTMHHAACERIATYQTRRNDPRCTRVGSFLRRTSLDELPQLWNVLIGDMSLVGPRPHADILHIRERSEIAMLADYAQRQRVKPGMTGWAQVHGIRGAINSADQLRRRIEYDVFYIDHWSILLDLRILALTPIAVFRAENAY